MNEFVQTFVDSIDCDDLIQLVLSSPVRSLEPVRAKVSIRPVEIKDKRLIQITSHEASRETHTNLSAADAAAEVGRLFGDHFRHGHLFTSQADVSGKAKADGTARVTRRKPTRQRADTSHNRSKHYLISEGTPCPFLIAIGVMTQDGRVRAARYDKFRQINRFLEFVEDIYASLDPDGVLRVVDFGCGKSYLTFAVHHLLTKIHNREVDITGLDLKQDVVRDCNDIAKRLDCRGLRFRAGDMSTLELDESIDLAVSLHACDTATDLALSAAIKWRAKAILSSPCCHHEFAVKMSRDVLNPIQQHGILRERFAELATDAYRAQVLEACGYRTQVVEFVDLEHTARNLLIRAVRRSNDDSADIPPKNAFREFRKTLGIQNTELERLLGSRLPPE